jgi:hypothetical protein
VIKVRTDQDVGVLQDWIRPLHHTDNVVRDLFGNYFERVVDVDRGLRGE